MDIVERMLCCASKEAAPYFNPGTVIRVSQVDERPRWTDHPEVGAEASHNPQ